MLARWFYIDDKPKLLRIDEYYLEVIDNNVLYKLRDSGTIFLIEHIVYVEVRNHNL